MNEICNYCGHQQQDGKGGVRCGATQYDYNEGYGPFKRGCVCVYDADLANRFEARTGEEINVTNLSAQVGRQHDEILSMGETIRKLKERLTRVES